MPWPLPQPGEIAARAASIYEVEFPRVYALKNPTARPVQVDARSNQSTLAVHARVTELTAWDLYLYQSRLADELMPDTAQDWLSRHGLIWGVPQVQPRAASGFANVSGAANVAIPAGEEFTAPGGALYVTTAAVTIGGGQAASLPVVAEVAGVAGNLPAGTLLTPVSAIRGLNPQSATVAGAGISGGLDLESPDSWRARILLRIRKRGGGGAGSDYIEWVGEVLPTAVAKPQQMSLGYVLVVFAMYDDGITPRAPTQAEVDLVSAYLNDPLYRKPLGMSVVVVGATLTPVAVTIRLNPDTVAIRAAATSALQLFFALDGTIGGMLDVSRLDAALSNASGEFSHDRIAPSADLTFGPTQLPVLGVVTFAGGT